MNFQHKFLPTIDLTNEDTDNGRYYARKDSNLRLPSVTTAISRFPFIDNTWKDDWEQRVGKEKAKNISRRGMERGTRLHLAYEKYFLNQDYVTGTDPFTLSAIESNHKIFSEINCVYGLEFALWSERLYTAGRTDLLGEYRGLPVVVDFKTSKYKKERKEILPYFLQVTTYAKLATEQTGVKFSRGIICIFCDKDPTQIYKFETDRYSQIIEHHLAGENEKCA